MRITIFQHFREGTGAVGPIGANTRQTIDSDNQQLNPLCKSRLVEPKC